MMLVDMSGVAIRQQYAEMIVTVMARIQSEAANPQCSPSELSQLMMSYAELVRATSGDDQ